MKIKDEIKITYRVTLNKDAIEEDFRIGFSVKDIIKELKRFGITERRYVMDYEVENVENIEESHG